MQFLHPVATVIAKSKLLVLPVYPAAWPQAKQHPFMQAMIRCYRYLASLLSHAEDALSLSADGTGALRMRPRHWGAAPVSWVSATCPMPC